MVNGDGGGGLLECPLSSRDPLARLGNERADPSVMAEAGSQES